MVVQRRLSMEVALLAELQTAHGVFIGRIWPSGGTDWLQVRSPLVEFCEEGHIWGG